MGLKMEAGRLIKPEAKNFEPDHNPDGTGVASGRPLEPGAKDFEPKINPDGTEDGGRTADQARSQRFRA